MSQPPGKIKEDHSTWIELDEIRTALVGSMGVLLVLADGLDGYARSGALSGDHAAAYAGTLFSAYDTLSGINKELREVLEGARVGTGEGGENGVPA